MRIILKSSSPGALERLVLRCLEFSASFAVPRRASVAFGFLALTVASTADQPPPVGVVLQPDPRVARLERFFQHYNCPQPHHVSDYLRASDGYRLDYRLLPAISVRESLCGVSEQMPNNHWGYHPSRQSFPSVEAGIDYVARQLAEGLYYQGKSLEQKLFVYNPRPKYPVEIQQIMRQIE